MAELRIADLPAPVTAAKVNWRAATTWMGFSPHSAAVDASAQREAVVNRQIAQGYVLEYISLAFGTPNEGFSRDPSYLQEVAEHAPMSGRLVAVHRLWQSSRSLQSIAGDEEFNRIQDTWATPGRSRNKWSVAFPVVESYDIEGWPKANEVFSQEAIKRVFAHPSSTLRPLDDDDRRVLDGLGLQRRKAINAWIAIEDEIRKAEMLDAPSNRAFVDMDRDLPKSAPEGMTAEQWVRNRVRVAWLADRFAASRRRAGSLICDDCRFDPTTRVGATDIRPRTLLDVHHRAPLAEGVRVTNLADFALLCPTCHRLEHERLRRGIHMFARPV